MQVLGIQTQVPVLEQQVLRQLDLLLSTSDSFKLLSEVLVLCLANSGAQLWSWRKQRQECRARVGRGHREGGDPTTLSPQTAVYRILQQKPLEMQSDRSQGSSWGCDL